MPSDYNDTGIATGAIANIQNGADAVPIKSWNVNIDPNLTGKSAVECTQAGKNLLPNKTYQRNATTLQIGTDTLDGTLTFQAGTYTLSVKTALTGATLNYTSGGSTTSISTSTDGDYRKGTFTLSKKTELFFGCYNSGGITSAQVSELQLEVGNSRTAYNAYNSTIHTVSLGRTIYGGSADVANGTGTDEYNKITLSSLLTDLNVAQIGTTGVYRIRFNLADAKGAVNSAVFNGLCDYYTPLSANQTYNKNEGISINTSGQCYIYDSRFNTSTSLNDFKTWIDANPVNLSYELATPTDFTFTPISPIPETVLGVNNFWADTGDSEVTYYKSGYGYTSVTVNQKDSSDTLIDTKTIKLHRLIYEGSVDVIRGIGTISVGESGTEYDPPESLNFIPISMSTIEGEQTLYSDEGNSAITYRKGVE